MSALNIRPAKPEDAELIFELVSALAEYEKLAHEVVTNPGELRVVLFGEQAQAEVIIAEWQGKPAGFALWFHNFSTFRGRRGLYLEDLFVKPEFRGKGIGKALLKYLAKIAVERNCARFEWSVLDWNQPAIEFYEAMGARVMEDWRICRMDGDALTQLARGD